MTRTEKAEGYLKWAAAYWIAGRRDSAFKCLAEALIHLGPRDEE